MSLAHLAARATFAAFVAAVNVPASLDAQALPIPTDNQRLRAALDTIKAQEAWTVSQQLSLCELFAIDLRRHKPTDQIIPRMSPTLSKDLPEVSIHLLYCLHTHVP